MRPLLAEIGARVELVQADTAGAYPPEASTVLANVAAVRELLGWLLPPALQLAIAAEQTMYDEEEARWEPATY